MRAGRSYPILFHVPKMIELVFNLGVLMASVTEIVVGNGPRGVNPGIVIKGLKPRCQQQTHQAGVGWPQPFVSCGISLIGEFILLSVMQYN